MTQVIQKTLRDSAGMRWTALLLLAMAMFCSYIFMDILGFYSLRHDAGI